MNVMKSLSVSLRQKKALCGDLHLGDQCVIHQQAKERILAFFRRRPSHLPLILGHPERIEENLDSIVDVAPAPNKAARYITAEKEDFKGTSATDFKPLAN